MGWFDYVSDIYSSISVQSAAADVQEDMKHASDPEPNSDKDQQGGGMGTAQQRSGSTTRGGVSMSVPHSGTEEESSEEADVNKSDLAKPQGEAPKGHTPGEQGGGEAAGQVGAANAGPHGGPVGKQSDDDEEDEEADEDEEEEDEPVDPMPGLVEDCTKTKECSPLKHHYEHCVERVTAQQEEHGKAHEDCVEEYFHLMHCATQCAAPKLFKQLR
ncbi:hypothetical protein MBLNU457_6940t1 [Dothideomycetes sp. NU457]